MEATPAHPHLRPLSLGDILDTIFRIYRQNFLAFAGIVALLFVPSLLLDILVTAIFGQSAMQNLLPMIEELQWIEPGADWFSQLPLANLFAYLGLSLFIGLIQAIILIPLVEGAVVHAASRSYLDRPLSILEAYGFGTDRMANLILARLLVAIIAILVYLVPFGLLAGLFVAIISASSGSGDAAVGALGVLALVFMMLFGLLLLFVIMLALVVCFLFVTHAVVLEGHGPVAAIGRSWKLATSSFWRVLGIDLLLTLLILVLTLVPSYSISTGVQIIFPDPIGDFAIQQILTLISSYVIQILVLPLSLIGFTLLYYDLRVRKEGFDLQLRTQTYEESELPTSATTA
jgi:hypothetical protein